MRLFTSSPNRLQISPVFFVYNTGNLQLHARSSHDHTRRILDIPALTSHLLRTRMICIIFYVLQSLGILSESSSVIPGVL
jgi:hypothetical protein